MNPFTCDLTPNGCCPLAVDESHSDALPAPFDWDFGARCETPGEAYRCARWPAYLFALWNAPAAFEPRCTGTK